MLDIVIHRLIYKIHAYVYNVLYLNSIKLYGVITNESGV